MTVSRVVLAALTIVLAAGAPARVSAAPACGRGTTGWCVAARFPGNTPEGELGFRFGEPLDYNGDGRVDIAAGSRFYAHEGYLSGRVTVWSGADHSVLRDWFGTAKQSSFFGHSVLPIPDLDGDGRADLILSAPNAEVDGSRRGVVAARSPRSGAELWSRAGDADANLGWDLALAGDVDGDGSVDVYVGEPSSTSGHVYLLSGRSGAILRRFAPSAAMASFGWYVARGDDFDGDGQDDLIVGAQPEHGPDDPPGGAAYVLSSATGEELHVWRGQDSSTGFGEVVAAIGDLNADHHGEIIVASPGTNDHGRSRPGSVRIYAGQTWEVLREWSGNQPGELFGRMVIDAGDVDGDNVHDVAIGAPWHRLPAGDHVGRVELRSGRTGEVLAEMIGDGPESWFGWHIRRAPDPDGRGRPALLIGSLRQPVKGVGGVGVIDLYLLQRPAHGTIKRGTRRSDIK